MHFIFIFFQFRIICHQPSSTYCFHCLNSFCFPSSASFMKLHHSLLLSRVLISWLDTLKDFLSLYLSSLRSFCSFFFLFLFLILFPVLSTFCLSFLYFFFNFILILFLFFFCLSFCSFYLSSIAFLLSFGPNSFFHSDLLPRFSTYGESQSLYHSFCQNQPLVTLLTCSPGFLPPRTKI